MAPNIPLLERLVAFACVEGVMFQGAFCSIFWFKKKNVLQGLWKANEFISRDENLHTRFAVVLYHHYTDVIKRYQKLSDARIKEIVLSAMAVTEEFTESALQTQLIGLTSEDMIKYIRCNADELCEALGYDKIYGVENPFDWMLLLGLTNKSNFFENTVTEYSKSKGEFVFSINEEF